jgi:hypothetical protein
VDMSIAQVTVSLPCPKASHSAADAQAPAEPASGISVEEEIKRTLDGVDAKKAKTNRNAPKKRPAASTAPVEPGAQPCPGGHIACSLGREL